MKSIYPFILLLNVILVGCNSSPKEILPTDEGSVAGKETGIFKDSEVPSDESFTVKGLHTVTVLEQLPTADYIYLLVREGNFEYWIATLKQEVKIGGQYVFRDPLVQKNFESKEYNRVFDELYLVGQIMPLQEEVESAEKSESSAPFEPLKIKPRKGAVPIAEIVSNPTKYAGKRIQISGRCVKINTAIMGRNWLHFQDGSNTKFDLVVTSDMNLAVGDEVTVSAIVALNKDFGAGYSYEIILEDGKLVE